jgi:hypothetical protein
MLKTKSTFFLLALTVATAFAANFGSFFTKITTNRSNKENRVKNSIPPPVMCSGRSAATVAVAPELWSNPATWGGVKPIAGQTVTIAANKHIILDENTPALAGLTINGTLEFDRKNVNLTANWIMVMGAMHVGSAALPFTQKATITLNGTDVNQDIMGMGTRGLMVMGGILELHASN